MSLPGFFTINSISFSILTYEHIGKEAIIFYMPYK